MARIELGRVGAVVNPTDGRAPVREAAELEALGYATIWITGGPLGGLDQVAAVVRGTEQARIAPGILSVDRFDSAAVAELYAELEADQPGRFVAGLGGAHGPRPISTLNAYLDRLDAAGVPAERRVLAALGPRMLDLAQQRAAGAFPVLVTPEYVVDARARLGDDTTLAVEQMVVVEADEARARDTVRNGPLGFLGRLPQYRASFARMGFGDEEIDTLDDRLVDGVVAWGGPDRVAARVDELLAAGADHIAVSVVSGPAESSRLLAEALAPLG